MTEKLSVLLMGAGSMGGAILKSWLHKGLLDTAHSAVIDPAPSEEIIALCKAYELSINPQQDQSWAICVLAFKPQQMPAIVPSLNWPDIQDTLFVSIAAGTSINTIATHLKSVETIGAKNGTVKIVRAMPNLPASIAQGMTLLFANSDVDEYARRSAHALMAATGDALWVESEEQIDSGMAITACGPAYVFLLAEALEQGGVEMGLSAPAAAKMARSMIAGAGALLAADARSAAQLRAAVTSPGGTTAAALAVIDGNEAMRSLVIKAVQAAKKRAEELAS